MLSPATSECCPLNLVPTTSVIAGRRGRSLPARLAVGFNAITVCAADTEHMNNHNTQGALESVNYHMQE